MYPELQGFSQPTATLTGLSAAIKSELRFWNLSAAITIDSWTDAWSYNLAPPRRGQADP